MDDLGLPPRKPWCSSWLVAGVHAAMKTHLWLGAVERGQGAGWFFGESKSQRCWHPHSMIQSTKTLSNTMGSGPPILNHWAQLETRGYIQSISNRLPELPKINHRHQYVIRANHSTAKNLKGFHIERLEKNMSLITPVVESNIWLWWQGAILLFWSALANIPSSVFPAML